MTFDVTEVDAIFAAAVELASPEECAEYVRRVCGENGELRKRVEELLAAHYEAGDFLERPPATSLYRDSENIQASPGTIIGPYKLLQQIGEGGMGVVFMAEQTQPIHRIVALKIIKPGMDTRQVIARFEAERQALAMMDHPNIAKVLDAGTTETGRPYFVMELVRGIPITEYCDREHLTVRQRLELIKPVCEAVQHAHQKGIIHRDIKPTNVLVAEYDGKPVPRVIDFGVAKATAQKLTQRTMFTEFGQVIGTVEYMSPEQARFNQLDIDTSSDIYSLGVLLYELLTGQTPFDRQRLRSAAFDEMLRIIREEEPPKPSTRLSKSDALPSIAANRKLEPKKLSGVVRGELDWIVMKCLEKDRNRRYETANGLVGDITRYLNNEAVAACPPSAVYRFRKFAARNRVPLLFASSAIFMLLVLVAGLAISNRLIEAQRKQAEAERNEKAAALVQKEEALERATAERKRAEDNFLRARMTVNAVLFEVALGRGEWAAMPASLRERFTQKTVEYYERLLRNGENSPPLLHETAMGYRSLAVLFQSLRKNEQAERFARQAIAIYDRLAAEHPDVDNYLHHRAYSYYVLAGNLFHLQRASEAEQAVTQAAEQYEDLIANRPYSVDYFLELPQSYRMLANIQRGRGTTEEVDRTIQKMLDLVNKIPPAAQKNTSIYLNLASELKNAGEPDKAITAYQNLIRIQPNNAAANKNLGLLLIAQGRIAEGIRSCNKAADLNHSDSVFINNLSWLQATAADPQFRDPHRAVQLAQLAVDNSPQNGTFWNTLGAAQYRAGQFQESIDSMTQSMSLATPDPFDWLFLAMALRKLGNTSEASTWYDKSAKWIDEKKSDDDELYRFRVEAAELLDVKPPQMPARNPAAAEPAAMKLAATDDTSSDQPTSDAQNALENANVVDLSELAIRQLQIADAERNRGALNKAVDHYRSAIRLRPGRVRPYHKLADTLLLLGNPEEAEDVYRSALRDEPRNGEFLRLLTAFLSEQQRPAEAEPLYREAIRLNPGDTAARLQMARTLFAQRQPAAAKSALLDMIQVDPNHAESHQKAGALFARHDLLAEAEQAFRDAIRLEHDDAWSQQQLGWVLAQQGKALEAEAALREALRLDPEVLAHAEADADRLASSGRLHDASDKFAGVIRAKPEYHYSLFRLASLTMATGDRIGYESVCRAMLDRFGNGNDPVAARRTAASCLLSNPPVGDPRELRRMAEFGVAEAPKSTSPSAKSNALRKLGLSAYRAGDWEAALEAARQSRAATTRPEYSAQNFACEAMALYQLGKVEEARAAYEEGTKSFAKAFPNLPYLPSGIWLDWLTYQPIQREAAALIRSASAEPAGDPRNTDRPAAK